MLKRTSHFFENYVKVDILVSVGENPESNARQIAVQNKVSETNVLTCLHKEKKIVYVN